MLLDMTLTWNCSRAVDQAGMVLYSTYSLVSEADLSGVPSVCPISPENNLMGLSPVRLNIHALNDFIHAPESTMMLISRILPEWQVSQQLPCCSEWAAFH